MRRKSVVPKAQEWRFRVCDEVVPGEGVSPPSGKRVGPHQKIFQIFQFSLQNCAFLCILGLFCRF